eukprot:TRINITY_DN912_c0_g1_i1.p1 TRINITY_DN912_c0_g1~~TRINITY_DN912_c0_g1_i1.p1  ORF type:complete len:569 (+),score=147.50 TRINITY_DN912_c0_g1_i1:93-1799(+)
MSLTSLLPPPRQSDALNLTAQSTALTTAAPVSTPRNGPPPYGKRKDFIPRSLEDFGDGGAFPEIHVAQYPLHMGSKKHQQGQKALTANLDASGEVMISQAIAKANASSDKVIYSTLQDAKSKVFSDDALARPSEEEELETAERTRQALEKITQGKIQSAKPIQRIDQPSAPTYVRYTPQQQGGAFNSGAAQRMIRLVEAPKDPLEPPKFKHKKVPRGPPSPPAPVLHSPPRQLTAKDQQDWKIPPCISNWKNPKGYTIALDKRASSDGRGLVENQINDNFAKLSQAMYLAERAAREEIEYRTKIEKEKLRIEKERKEEELRELAAKARLSRSGALMREEESEKLSKEDLQQKEERDRIRDERMREREHERRKEAKSSKKSRLARDDDRDVGEQIALGQVAPTLSGENMYDQRLFNQSAGMDSGFGAEDNYNIYDKPLFSGSSANTLYRPKKAEFDDDEEETDKGSSLLSDTGKFKPDRGFSGADAGGSKGGRSKPIEFEKNTEEVDDPFFLGQYMQDVKKGKESSERSRTFGTMHAAAGSGSGAGSHDDSSSRRGRVEFERSKGRSGR